MKKVLIITYYWPPSGGAGVQRWLKFVKYLRNFGWEAVVLTVEDGSYPSLDESLLKDVPEGLEVHKTRSFEPFAVYNSLSGKKGKSVPMALIGIKDSKSIFQKLSIYIRANFFIPDARKGWKKYALPQAKKLLASGEIDVVLTTGPPQSTHLIGLELKYSMNIPWVADFRDPWTTVYYNKFFPRTKRTERIDRNLETSVLNKADLVTVVSEGLKEELQDRAKKVAVVYNGYDPEDMEQHTGEITTEHFTLCYTGNLKPNQNAVTLWKVLGKLVQEDAQFAADLRIALTGNIDPTILQSIKSENLEKQLIPEGYVLHSEAVRQMKAANMLLFIVPDAVNNRLILTGKLFEYMASGTPMLSIGPVDGNAAHMIKDAGHDAMIDYHDEAAIRDRVLQYYNKWKQNDRHRTEHPLDHSVTQYSRVGQTERLSQLLNEVSGKA